MLSRICLISCLLFSSQALAQQGREVFAAQCQVCHGDGHGTERGPNLADNRRVRAQTREQLLAVVRNGIPGSGMPAFNLPVAELDAVTDFVRSLSAPAIDSAVEGNRAVGEQLFFSTAGCASCHMVFGLGKTVGPDLSSLGRQLTVDAIRQAILSPSANIKKGYATVNLQLANGESLSGFARNESRYNIQLQDPAGRFHFLSAGEYEVVSRESRSFMPEGKCAGAECDNLVAYLSSLGGVDVDTDPFPFGSTGGPTFEQIAHPQSGDWTTYHGAISGNRHSELDQITAANVSSLALKWVFPINHFVLELTPVVVDGVMYVTGPNQVFALDARQGRTLWHYQRPRSTDVRGDPAKGTNRGVAVLGDRVFTVTDNGRLLALHRVTGELVWETDLTAGLDKNNYGNTSAPLVVNDMVVAGISGGDLGVRGFLSAFKVDTGEQVWRFWTVPAPGEPLSETWQGTALAEFGGGGGTWMTGTYDPETDTVFWGVGNPYPSMNGDERRGDNLYTDSVLALDSKTGALKWYYQFTPHDLYDWDGGQTPMILNARYRGQDRKLLLQANRNGFFYVFDRTNGELLLGEQFVDKLNWATGIGSGGRPIVVPGLEPAHDGTKVCPNVLGAANWPSVAFSPETQLFYVQAREACGIYVKPPRWNPKPIPLEPGRMFLRALDIETGERKWELPQIGTADSWGGVLSTAGGLVFFGEDSGALGAVDAATGEDLWHIQTNASTELGDGHSWRSSPMTYLAGGKQYIAVSNGPNILVFGLP
ncbi:MAG: PQQ-binding-like beta-propeller repeat protein [Acidobacteria bacterium]|nr:PQQ-binding-like beta-propeller repeat protein [Acidobacteriota bacterium]MDA1235240.1 PQQ-binding-like beta-propeller repeat protein [Acidobacteriota bacterium]